MSAQKHEVEKARIAAMADLLATDTKVANQYYKPVNIEAQEAALIRIRAILVNKTVFTNPRVDNS